MWPFKGRVKVTSPYGYRTLNGKSQFHKGIDLVGVDSTDVISPFDGVVGVSTIITDKNNKTWEWGNYVRIDSNGYKFYFCHMDSRSVVTGQKVTKGQKIGVMGNTGYSFGAHTHFEVRDSSGQIDPTSFINIPNVKGTYTDSSQDGDNKLYYYLDISKHQSTFNANVAKQNGVNGVICRCAYATSKDIKWDEFAQNVKDSGMNLGAYGFLTAHYNSKCSGNITTAIQVMYTQVDTWISLCKEKGCKILAVDQELESGNSFSLSAYDNTNLLLEACKRIENAGLLPMLYASASWIKTRVDLTRFTYPLWVAYYYNDPNDPDFNTCSPIENVNTTYGNWMKQLGNQLWGWQFGRTGYGSKYGVGSSNVDKNIVYYLYDGGDEMEFTSDKLKIGPASTGDRNAIKTLADQLSVGYEEWPDGTMIIGPASKGDLKTFYNKAISLGLAVENYVEEKPEEKLFNTEYIIVGPMSAGDRNTILKICVQQNVPYEVINTGAVVVGPGEYDALLPVWEKGEELLLTVAEYVPQEPTPEPEPEPEPKPEPKPEFPSDYEEKINMLNEKMDAILSNQQYIIQVTQNINEDVDLILNKLNSVGQELIK